MSSETNKQSKVVSVLGWAALAAIVAVILYAGFN